MARTIHKSTQEVMDLIERGLKNPLELALRTQKTVKSIHSIGYRYDIKLDNLPTSARSMKLLEKEIKEKLRKERLGLPAEESTDLQQIKENITKDPAYYIVLTISYRRVLEHIDKLVMAGKGLPQLRKDLEHAASITESKVVAKTTDLEELVT